MEKTIVESGAVTGTSWQPVEYLHGKTGETTIRHGPRKVQLEEIITHSFFLRLDEVYPSCPLANAVAQTNSIEGEPTRFCSILFISILNMSLKKVMSKKKLTPRKTLNRVTDPRHGSLRVGEILSKRACIDRFC